MDNNAQKLVTKVAEEVIRRLSPPETNNKALTVPSALSKVPLGSNLLPLLTSVLPSLSEQADAVVLGLSQRNHLSIWC